MPLPVAYQPRLQTMPGVELVTHNSWFGGSYQNTPNAFATIVVDPEPMFKMYPEFKLPPDQMKAWLADRQGAVVGRDDRRSLRLEDRRPRAASRGHLAAEAGRHLGVQHRRHLRRRAGGGQDAVLLPLRLPRREPPLRRRVGRLVPRPRGRPVTVGGDRRRSSTRCSRTRRPRRRRRPKRGSSTASRSRSATSRAIFMAIIAAALFSILLVAANVMMHSVRERTSEIGVLKTLGFTDGATLRLVLAESIFVAVDRRRPRPADVLDDRQRRGSPARRLFCRSSCCRPATC